MTTGKFDSEGFDLDALGGQRGNGGASLGGAVSGNDVVYEIGGGVSHSAPTATADDDIDDDPTAESERLKAEGNAFFLAGQYDDACDKYNEAIEACPGEPTGAELLRMKEEHEEKRREESYRRHREETDRRRGAATGAKDGENDEESGSDDEDLKGKELQEKFVPPRHPHGAKLAVYHCNRAACLLRMGRDEDAVSDCDISLMLNPVYVKAYLRRMSAQEKLEKTDLALEDAKAALALKNDTSTRKNVVRLEKIEAERLEKLKEETMGKLKDLGNSILGNFGLSLDNFKATQDPSTGSYNISFEQNK
uniref:Tetratricopeptide repeat protein 1 n=1 Tax=Trieres chinensis TaxID=1514140 RepID=A0A7S2EDA0_TRICV|eukprot:CAMPEP_0183295510 /NCGR_PEP_ID=MMETSP0160_2-20130417/3438_1 /TAXON_ID=2839 ORGANISM="Odontella Sinensis, Strain Grunow 1884" /NCGR_SAMPLE_ID=MMETSP0160_2 /ASSEMBLY_ACC=CAM_ASM_000250 /LENGTH=306 /DNA_ID=CAMNT_0025457001 /DNA_START=37 /DNA_END=957 /DNA_ORIENTATION=-